MMKNALLFLVLFNVSATAMELSFRASVIKGSELRVKDVLDGAEALGEQPWPSKMQNWVSQEQVEQWLSAGLPGTSDIRWQGRKKTWVKVCQPLLLSELETDLKWRLKNQFGVLSETANIAWETRNAPCITQPIKTISIASIQPSNQPQLTVRAQLLDVSGKVTQYPVQVTVDADINTLHLKKSVTGNTPLSLAAFKVKREKWTGKQYSADQPRDKMQFQKSKKAGSVVFIRDLEERFMVNAGDAVTVLLQKGAIKIETKGKAMDNAEIGETLRIKVESSQKLSNARVIAEGVVLVKA